jgi:hypothetical protein
MWFRGAYIAATGGRDKDRATGMSSLANEEPLMVVKAGVDIMGEVIRKDCGDSRDSVVREGKAPLRRGGSRSVHERTFRAEDGDVGRSWSGGSHWGSKVLSTRGSDEDVVRVNGDIFVERGEEEGVEDFLGYTGGCRRHG